ncbi:Autoinducer 2 sensor kinase/phosphatase LuxQ [Marinibacterium anthonyi]|nr:Autoinducer 2 sensor kinase/phosphatase LuxQ [Marinibacterium anthonyi]
MNMIVSDLLDPSDPTMDEDISLNAMPRRAPLRGITGAAAIGLVISVALVGWMAVAVLRQIDALSAANSDNLQWSLSQAEVEFLRFRLAIEQAQQDPAKLPDLRRNFDIFYSRMATIERGVVFRAMRNMPHFVGPRTRVRQFLEETVPIIDSQDDVLIAAIPDLEVRATEVGEDVRAFSLSALVAFAKFSDERRGNVLHLMAWLAVVLVSVFVAMGILAVSHLRLYRLAERRAEQIASASARMHTIVETSPHAIVVTDEFGTIREFNPSAERIFGHSRAEARGRNMIELLIPPRDFDRARTTIFAFIDENRRPDREERHFEIEVQGRDGRLFPAEFAIDRAETDNPMYLAHIRDISRRKSDEEELTKARDQALAGERAKSEFLAVMSHEMRTPLNGLLGTMQLMSDDALSKRQEALLSRMKSSGQMLLGLVNDVLDLAKYEAGKMKADHAAFALERLMKGVVETAMPLAQSYGNSLDWQWVGDPPGYVMGDMRRLRQVLLNLVSNAIKFTRNGIVEIEGEYLNEFEVEFRVIDNGIGIDEDDLDRIFNDFETLDSSYAREAGGTGLGLGISRRLARLMGGEIGAESEPGEGSLFWVRVPLQPIEQPEEANDDSEGGGLKPDHPLDVLLVEDNEINRFIVTEMLAADGHDIVEAENGQDGVHCAAMRRFDVILMDISMPVMDGTEATRQIRSGGQASCDSPIVALTAHALPEERDKFREIGMSACLTKPIDRDLLLRTLAEVMRGEVPLDDDRERSRTVQLLDDRLLSVLLARVPREEVCKLFDRFLDEAESDVMKLAEADPNDPDLAPVAHKCSGSCGTFGAEAMRVALTRIQTGVKLGTPPSREELAALVPLWHKSRAAIFKRLEGIFTEA